MNGTTTSELADVPGIRVPSSGSSEKAPAVAGGRAARAHRVIARVLLAGIAVQFFLSGLGVFGITSILPHVIFGSLVVLASFALPIIAWRGHLATTIQRRSWLLSGLLLLQGGLIDLGQIVPIISAFHPVNALVIGLVTYSMIGASVTSPARTEGR